MSNRLILAFALCIQSCFALTYAVDPIDFGTSTPAEIRAYNLKRQAEVVERWNKEFAKTDKDIQKVISSFDAPHIKQTLSKSGVLSDGSKVEVKAVVTKPADKAKVAQVLTERLKNAKDYAKNVGKASIPSFVGMAAFHGLMKGIGWVMDEGGKVTKPNSLYDPKILPTDDYVLVVYAGSSSLVLKYYSKISYDEAVKDQLCKKYVGSNTRFSWPSNCLEGSTIRGQVSETANPLKTQPKPEDTVVSDSDIQIALQQALLNNNAMQAAMIAQAIKDAYSYDRSEGQKPSSNTLVKEAADDMAVALPKAFDNPVPTSNPERPSGYYKITDGDKTVEGYVTPAPISSTTDSTTTPILDPVTGQPTGSTTTTGSSSWPALCDYALKFCEWMDWTQEPVDEDQTEKPNPPSDQGIFDWSFNTDFNLGGQCPADLSFTWTGKYFAGTHTISLQWLCLIFTFLGYPLVFLSHCIGVWIFYEVASRKELKSGY